MSIEERFNTIDDESDFHYFDDVVNKKSNREDVHAILMLDSLFPGNTDMICRSEHDRIWFDIDDEDLEKLTDDQIRDLIRCGVFYDPDSCGLTMFV